MDLETYSSERTRVKSANATAISDRNRMELSRQQLLADYSKISSGRRGAAEATAIRNQSRQYLDILAFEASGGTLEFDGLREKVRSCRPNSKDFPALDPAVLAEIGRVLILHPCTDGDREVGRVMLEHAVTELPTNGKTRRFRMLLVQDQILNRQFERAGAFLDLWKDVDNIENKYLRAEMSHPAYTGIDGISDEWLQNFNRPFKKAGLEPVGIESGRESLFDRLTTSTKWKNRPLDQSLGADLATPLVTVVVTAYRPTVVELETSVKSILNQSIQDFEIIVVDDFSGPDFDRTFELIEELDHRIEVARMTKNSGTYAARNFGFSLARGEFVTGQDDDDWSHPQRLETQVSFLCENPNFAGCRVYGLMCGPNLERVRRGYYSVASNASTLMVRNSTMQNSGGFINARKAADTELAQRIEHITGMKVEDLRTPLTVVRILPDSLSRKEFGAGWSHPARRQFKSSYKCWHTEVSKRDLRIDPDCAIPVYVPRRFRPDLPTGSDTFDVVLAGDWRQYGGPQKSMIEEIKALTSAGLRVAVMHMEAPRFMSTVSKPMTIQIQRLINNGTVEEVLYDDHVRVKLLILRYPPILQFAPDSPSELQVEKMFILANQAPSEADGSDIRYLVQDCHKNAVRIFTEKVSWVPQGPLAREAITPYLSELQIEGFDLPGIVDPLEWQTTIPRSPRSQIPVVGRHSRDNVMKWPDTIKAIELIYPTDGLFDIRIMGGSKAPEAVLGQATPPAGWTVYPTDALDVKAFLNSLDFFVFFQNPIATEAFGRAILEAIAADVVVILPTHYQEVFKDAAIYAEPTDVIDTVKKYHFDRDLYRTQQLRARDALNSQFTHASYIRRISREIVEDSLDGSAS